MQWDMSREAEQADKPDSVVDGHLSGASIAQSLNATYSGS
jgi:hypothetical protein